MLSLAFIATLFCLLPFFNTVSVKPLLLSPKFLEFGEEVPCVWPDGVVNEKEGKVYISLGQKSSLLVYSRGKEREHYYKEAVAVELSEPDSYIFIATEKDNFNSNFEEHEEFIRSLASETLFGKGTDAYNRDYRSHFYAAILRTVEPDPVSLNSRHSSFDDFCDLENLIKAENVSVTIEDQSETENCLPNYLDIYSTPFAIHDNGPNISSKETEALRKDLFIPQVQKQPSQYSVKGSQFQFYKHNEPMICLSDGEMDYPEFVSSLTGKVRQVKTPSLNPFIGKYRIPDDTKLLIVNMENSKKYYKNITGDSKVWYLQRNEKFFYPCIVQTFSRSNQKPTLKCGGLEPAIVVKVSWDDIFPIESSNLIKDLGEFKVQLKDINWDEIAKQTSRNKMKSLPRKRENTVNEQYLRKEQRIYEEAGANNFDRSFGVGDQLSCNGQAYPLIYLSTSINGKEVWVLDPYIGKIRKLCRLNLIKFHENPQISTETKMSQDGKLKIILQNSHVLYRNSDGRYCPCKVTRFSDRKPIKILCDKLGEFTPRWDEIFPIEASSVLI